MIDEMTEPAWTVRKAEHTGFAVASLDEALAFWTGAMGFELVRRADTSGPFIAQVTGVATERCRMAIVAAPDGYWVELLEYACAQSPGRVPDNPGAVGAAHIAFIVSDIHAAVKRTNQAGWPPRGSIQSIPGGPRQGTLCAYVTGPDNITIEFLQPPAVM